MRGYEHQSQDMAAVQQPVRTRRSAQKSGGGSPLRGAVTPQMILALQRSVGNATVVRLLDQRRHACDPSHRHQGDRGHQGRQDDQAVPAAPAVQRSSVPAVLRASGKPMPDALRTEMETRLGANFSTVRIHSDPAAERSAMAVDARAYTSGEHIVGGPGALDRPTIAHELTHVLQQRSGPVAGNDHGDGLRVSDPSDRFEREADANATGVMNIPAPVQRAATPAPPAEGPAAAPPSAGVPIVQRATVRDHTMAFETPAYTPNNGRAGRVSVNNIRGKPLGEAANSPTAGTRPIGWDELYNKGHTHANPNANKSHYNAVKMHLMNGRLGGPGTNVNNLAPGPASINSSMSAGPEKAAKAAVSAGKFIWLETSVTYQNNTVNANDVTSVVPNSMTMSWGYMANRSPTNFTRGPAQGPAWSETIDQPAGALTVPQQTAYKGFTNTVDLDAQLNAGGVLVSHQELAQAYTLVATAALSITRLNTSTAMFTRTGWKTSGRCSSDA